MGMVKGTQHTVSNGVDPEMVVRIVWYTDFDECYGEYVKAHSAVHSESLPENTCHHFQQRFERNKAWGWVDMSNDIMHVVEANVLAPKNDRTHVLLPVIAHELAHLYFPAENAEQSERAATIIANIVRMAQELLK